MYSVHVKDQRMHFSASHFLRFCGDCEHLHGHNYTLEVFIIGPLNDDGMVVDFRAIKDQVVSLCKTLDHKVMLPKDSTTIEVKTLEGFVEVNAGAKRYVFPEEDCIILPTKATTAELLAKHIHSQLKFQPGFRIKVCVSESAGSTACFED
ncbi:6-pyruvoyl tetrahydropterin synthase family protein [Candidatus Thorarchaeota archaeon]|nr:MAG: 6-pyruvoyl tetrahydropterin synthase family protein [Candidatus Thorarchaeota archaeon]